MPWELLIGLVLLFFFITGVFLMFKYLYTPSFHLNVQESICRGSIGLSQATAIFGYKIMNPICNTALVTFNEKFVKQQARSGESVKDAGTRFILERLESCKEMVTGDRRDVFLAHNTCYVCTSLHTDSTTPFITEKDLDTYTYKQTDVNGKTYFYTLNSDAHGVLVDLKGGIRPNRDYGITYQAPQQGNAWYWFGSFCVLGIAAGTAVSAAVTALTGGVGVGVGVVAGAKVALFGCSAGVGAAGGAKVYNTLTEVNYKGLLILTDYTMLEKKGCDTYVS